MTAAPTIGPDAPARATESSVSAAAAGSVGTRIVLLAVSLATGVLAARSVALLVVAASASRFFCSIGSRTSACTPLMKARP